MTASGIGFEQNDEVARMWLSRAADSGNKYAQANLAVLYRDGRGGAKDLQRARSLAQSAVDQGLPEAEPLLRSLGVKGVKVRLAISSILLALALALPAVGQGLVSPWTGGNRHPRLQ